MNYGVIVPKKSEFLEINDFDNNKKLVHQTKLGYRLAIDDKSYTILKLINNENNIFSISEKFNTIHNIRLSPNEIYDVLKNKFENFGIVSLNSEFKTVPKSREIHLKLSVILLNEKIVNKISSFFVFLFQKNIFIYLSTSCVLFILFVISNNMQIIIKKLNSPIDINFIYLFILFELASFLHEFGHASACKKFGAKPGGIGFGFYYIIPVLFSDVSDSWKLKPKERVIINFAGIYFELILSTLFVISYLITSFDFFLIFPILLLLDTLHNLNPFLKFDGYWILSDLIKIHNLHKTSNRTFIKFIKNKPISFSHKKKWFLIIYEILSKCYIVFIIIILLFTNYNSILAFPITIYNYFLYLTTLESTQINNFRYIDFIIPTLFYFLLIKSIISILKSKLKKLNTKRSKLSGSGSH